jgi:hypothetical protein
MCVCLRQLWHVAANGEWWDVHVAPFKWVVVIGEVTFVVHQLLHVSKDILKICQQCLFVYE